MEGGENVHGGGVRERSRSPTFRHSVSDSGHPADSPPDGTLRHVSATHEDDDSVVSADVPDDSTGLSERGQGGRQVDDVDSSSTAGKVGVIGASSETGVMTKMGLGGHEVREGNGVGGGRVRQGLCRFPCKDKTKHDLVVSTLLEAH